MIKHQYRILFIKIFLIIAMNTQISSHIAFAQPHSLTVIPPGPVTDKINVEIRLAVRNHSDTEEIFKIRFYWDRIDLEHFIHPEITTIMKPNGCKLVRAWWETAGHAGNHNLRYQVESKPSGRVAEGNWPIEVISSETSALPLLLAGWCDPGAFVRGIGYPMARNVVKQDILNEVDAMKRIGMNTIIITYVEMGYTYYPSDVLDYPYFGIDVVEAMLSQADVNGMHVFLGLGRGDDTYLLWDGLDDKIRIETAIELSSKVARELWEKYHHHPSFYGWYFTHEMNDLAKASRYYDPLADTCHAFSPDKPVLVAPAGTPIINRRILNKSHVDIFAYQDAVGPGYKNYRYTLDPEIRIADLDSVYGRYSGWHQSTDKHLWSDLEIWRANPATGYTPFNPAPFEQVERQMEIESNYVEMLTGYEFLSMMEFPESTLMLGGEEAVRLYNEYSHYYETYWNEMEVPLAELRTQSNPALMVSSYPNPFNSATTIRFVVKEPSFVCMKIYNIRGRQVRTLLHDRFYTAGAHQIKWDGRDDYNRRVATGIYLLECRLGTEYRNSIKLIVSR